MGIEIITNDLNNKGIILTGGQKSAISRFVNKNCSYYLFLNFLRITNGNVADAIQLYRFDEALRNLLLKYILRLEVQLKKDFIYYVESTTNDLSFWNNSVYYKSAFVRNNGFIKLITEVTNSMNKMNFTGIGPENNRMFYSTSFGTFKRIFSNMKANYLSLFTYKYVGHINNSRDKLNAYLYSIQLIRNRCCHSNHLISTKFQYIIESSNINLESFGNITLQTNFDKTLFFINSRLEYPNEMKKEFIKLLIKYEKIWKIYLGRHVLSTNSILNIQVLWKN